MSRWYEMSVCVKGYDKSREVAICSALEEEWEWEDTSFRPSFAEVKDEDRELFYCGQSNLCGGESEEEFSRRVAEAVFKANGGKCKVKVSCTYMEDLPREDYEFDEDSEIEVRKDEEDEEV